MYGLFSLLTSCLPEEAAGVASARKQAGCLNTNQSVRQQPGGRAIWFDSATHLGKTRHKCCSTATNSSIFVITDDLFHGFCSWQVAMLTLVMHARAGLDGYTN